MFAGGQVRVWFGTSLKLFRPHTIKLFFAVIMQYVQSVNKIRLNCRRDDSGELEEVSSDRRRNFV